MGRSSTADGVKAKALTGKDLAARLAQDERFRQQLVTAVAHGAAARRRARSRVGWLATAHRLATDEELRGEVQQMVDELRRAWSRVGRTRSSHRTRNTLLALAGLGAAAAVVAPKLKSFVSGS